LTTVFVTHLSLAAYGGAADRVRGLVRGLEAAGHSVRTLQLPIVGRVRKVLTWRRHPWWYLSTSKRLIDGLAISAFAADLVVLDYLPVAARLAPRLVGRVPVVYAAHNDELRLATQHASAAAADAIAEMQDLAVACTDVTWVPGELDRASLQARYPDARVVNLPNGVSPLPDFSRHLVRVGKCFTYGSWAYGPNHDGLLNILGARVAQPGGEVVVFGGLGREIARALETPRTTGIQWTVGGFEPSWERMVTRGGGRAFVPVWSGAGTKLRVVQLAAMGVPTVATSEAVSGLPAWLTAHVPISDDAEELVERALFGRVGSIENRLALRARVYRELSWETLVVSALRESADVLGRVG
jgi:hypothetical protein